MKGRRVEGWKGRKMEIIKSVRGCLRSRLLDKKGVPGRNYPYRKKVKLTDNDKQ